MDVRLADLTEKAPPPVVTFTDGPMELWIGVTGGSQDIADGRVVIPFY